MSPTAALKRELQAQISAPLVLPKKHQCPSCPYKAGSGCDLSKHIRIHTGEKPFQCNFCPYKCNTKGDLEKHYITHTRERPHKCPQCEFTFANKYYVAAHILALHSEARPYSCSEEGCDWKFKLKTALTAHVKRVHEKRLPPAKRRFPCNFCPLVLTSDANLQRHLRTHTGEKPYKCSKCDFQSAQKGGLKNHVLSCHSGNFNFPCKVPGCRSEFKLKSCLKGHVEKIHKGITRFQCPECPREFYDSSSMKDHHLRFHLKEKSFKCNICEYRGCTASELRTHKKYTHSEFLNLECDLCGGKKFKNSDTLRQHRNKQHGGKPKTKRQVPCREPNCEKQFASKTNLKLHLLGFHKKGPPKYSCPLCPYTTSCSSTFAVHMRVHSGEAPYKCDECRKFFRSLANRQRHKQQVHSGARPFECKLCEYKGKTKPCLKKHQETHNQNPVKCYSCSLCSYKCKTNSSLRTHLVSHGDERPFQCEECDYKAKTRTHLTKHMVTHSVERPYKCTKCNRAFKTNILLKSHMRSHNDVRPFKCEIKGCSVRFKAERYIKVHVKMVHNRETEIQCPYCPRVLARRWEYQEHIRTHTEEKPFKCDLCEFRTGISGVLMRHKKFHRVGGADFVCNLCCAMFKAKFGLVRHLARHRTLSKCSFSSPRLRASEELKARRKTFESNPSKSAVHNNEQTGEDYKPCFVRLVRLKILTQ